MADGGRPRSKFFDPLYKRAREYLNGQIAALITPALFNSNAPIIGAVQGEVKVADQLNAWAALADQKVPLEDRDKLRLMVHNRVYQNMLGDTQWVQESLVSAAIAFEAREKADVGHAFNFQVVWDQQMPTSSGSILYGQTTVTSNSAVVTGSTPSSQLGSRRARPTSRSARMVRPPRRSIWSAQSNRIQASRSHPWFPRHHRARRPMAFRLPLRHGSFPSLRAPTRTPRPR